MIMLAPDSPTATDNSEARVLDAMSRVSIAPVATVAPVAPVAPVATSVTVKSMFIKALWQSLYDAPDEPMHFYAVLTASSRFTVAYFPRGVTLDDVTRRALWQPSPPPYTLFDVAATTQHGTTTISVHHAAWSAVAHFDDMVVCEKPPPDQDALALETVMIGGAP